MTKNEVRTAIEESECLVQCRECGNHFTALPSHLQSKHDMNIQQYRDEHGDVPVVTTGSVASREKLITELTQLADELGHRPTSGEVRERTQYSIRQYYSHWDCWDEVLTATGLTE